MWKVASYMTQGLSHKKNGIPCQDYVYTYCENNVEVIALADGAGSASFSQWGAETVTKQICKSLSVNFREYITSTDGQAVKEHILWKLRIALEKTAKEHSCSVKDLASTLLAVAVQENEFMAIHIGDGVIGCIIDGVLRTVSKPVNGEFSNQTYFVTSEQAGQVAKLYKGNAKNIDYFILMSDGTQASLYNPRTQELIPAVSRIAEWNSCLSRKSMSEALEDSMLNVIAQNTDDDCSIIMMSRPNNKIYQEMSDEDKYELLLLSGSLCNKKIRKKIKKFDCIMEQLVTPMTADELSRKVHIKRKYLVRDLKILMECGLIEKQKQTYILSDTSLHKE